MKRYTSTKGGFTLVELLIVIVIIAILAAITIVAYNGIQNRATDSRRAKDMSNIKTALMAYDAANGGLPRVTTYLTTTYSGWDMSAGTSWLSFLRTTNGTMPVDPVNSITGTNPPATGNTVYFYTCYPAGSGPLPATDNARIGYHKTDGTLVYNQFPVTACT